MGTVVLGVCLLVLVPAMPKEDDLSIRFLIVGLLAAAVPFFIALIQTLKLLGLIDRHTAFSELSVKALKVITVCALVVSLIFATMLPALFTIAQREDAPGVAGLGCIVIFASIVIAVFAAVLQRILRDAIRIKTENDLTV
jgi:putative flippase GtrA